MCVYGVFVLFLFNVVSGLLEQHPSQSPPTPPSLNHQHHQQQQQPFPTSFTKVVLDESTSHQYMDLDRVILILKHIFPHVSSRFRTPLCVVHFLRSWSHLFFHCISIHSYIGTMPTNS